MKIRTLTFFIFASVIVALTSCAKKEATPTSAAQPTSSPPPVPESPLSISSPLQAGPSWLPAPSARDITPFRLDRPIIAGALQVTGQGPAGVPIALLDITFGGPLLASGQVDEDGRFALELDAPLEAQHRIGIALGDLNGTGWEATDFSSEFHGDEAMNFPRIGFFFDTFFVGE